MNLDCMEGGAFDPALDAIDMDALQDRMQDAGEAFLEWIEGEADHD